MGAFEDTLSEITGESAAAAPEVIQAQAAPESSSFEAALAAQETSPAQSQNTPEPGGGMDL